MIKLNFDTEDASLARDIELLELTQKYFSNNKEWVYTSSKLRHILDNVRYPAVSLKTFDKGVKILNENLNRKNPASDIQSISATYPIHTYVFYKRLYIYLIGKEQSLLNCGNINYISNTPFPPYYGHIFDIRKPRVSPSFSPLFVGLIGSLNKEKDWRKLKENTLLIAQGFYADDYQQLDKFYPSYQDNGETLYKYWLDVLFPDELFDLTLKIEQKIIQTYETLLFDLRHNLYLLAESLINVMFKTRTGQKEFYQHMSNKLNEYTNSSIKLLDEFTSIRNTIIIFENDIFHRYQSQNTLNNSHIEN